MKIYMDSLNKYIIGTCEEMCPFEEIKMRERQKLLHVLEMIPGTEKSSIPKADKNRMVKSFSRSAAGRSMLEPNNLRPPNVLLKTVNYLLEEIVSRKDVPWTVVYDFVMDRLRSVRQDLVIQNISYAYCVSILQPIIRFHAYASYRLCEENINYFDPVLNNTHLQECLKRLLTMYDYCEQLEKRDDNRRNNFLNENRPQFEALYLIFNLGNSEAIKRALSLPKIWRTNLVETALKFSLSYTNNNFIRSCRIINELPKLHQGIAALHLPMIRRNALKIMSAAYSSKNLRFPVTVLKGLLLYNSDHQLINDCRYYGLEVIEDGISFIKNSFDENTKVVSPLHQEFVDQRLNNIDISTLLLFGE